jgi:hypothetical protein
MVLIGLVGFKGSGKSVVANALVTDATDKNGTKLWKKGAFAAPLKQGLHAMFGLSDAQLHLAEYKEVVDPRYGVTPRQLMQVVGTDLLRHELVKHFPSVPNIWVSRMHEFIATANAEGMNVVVEDVRFPEEVECIRKHGGKLVLVTRPSAEDGSGAKKQHESETYVGALPWDSLLVNNGSVSELQAKALAMVK